MSKRILSKSLPGEREPSKKEQESMGNSLRHWLSPSTTEGGRENAYADSGWVTTAQEAKEADEVTSSYGATNQASDLHSPSPSDTATSQATNPEPGGSKATAETNTVNSQPASGNSTPRLDSPSSNEFSEDWDRPWRRSEQAEQEQDTEEEKKEATSKSKSKKKEKIQRKRPKLWRKYSDRDTKEYRKNYPGKKDNPDLNLNHLFYTNQIASNPDGAKIDEIHQNWYGNYDRLESHHGYIQWIFPIRESGMNFHAQELQLHEAKAIKKNPEAMKRVLKSYEMMLDFYGMRIVDHKTGQVARARHWRDRFRHLNRSMHNYLRITRMLKSLGELGYEYYKVPFVEFVMKEAFENETLTKCIDSCVDFWVHTIRCTDDRLRLVLHAYKFVED